MLGFYNYKNYSGMLNDFLDIVENDTSSILYHTRVLDEAFLNGILNFYNNNDIEVTTQYSFNNNFEFFLNNLGYLSFFFLIYFDFISSFFNLFNILFDTLNDLTFNDFILNFFFNFFIITLDNSFIEFFSNNYVFFFQKNEFFKSITTTVDIFSDFLFHIDLFLIIIEILLILFLFLLLFNKVSNFFITTKFYDNILNFFKYNNISFLEISITCTLFVSFYIFDIFLSFSEDDFSDTFFYLILIFIVLMFFFLSIAMDIQYFYSMSNTSNGDMSIRLLFFDILNNFLGILRIFLC